MADSPKSAEDRPGSEESVGHLMEAVRPIAALAARLGSDSKLAAELVDAARKDDPRRMEEIFRAAGVEATATVGEEAEQTTAAAARPAGRTRTYGITVNVGPIQFSIKVEVKK